MGVYTQNLEKKRTAKFSRLFSEPVGLLMAALVSLSFTSHAGTFVSKEHGKYTDAAAWQNGYPTNFIKENDTVYINSNMELSGDIVIKGVLVVGERSSLIGSKNLVVLENGAFYNKGITIVNAVTNRGSVKNQSILETNVDFINTGTLENNQSMIVGNILDNTGIISGKAGNIISNIRFVNTAPGRITGSIDICSNDFSNVGGGTLDSTSVSFCGNRIFSSMFLTASIGSESIQLKLNNSHTAGFAEYQIEKSIDGENFQTIAHLRSADVKNNNGLVTYQDNSKINSNTIYYRMKLVDGKGTESFVPAVEIGSIHASKNSVSKL